jgi:hypothetical protein
MRAVRKHTDCPWVLLYIERWLKAPVQMPDGSLAVRERGTPQGGVVSPVLANLFCTMRLMCGCTGTIRAFPSSAMPTMVCQERIGSDGSAVLHTR